MPKYVIERNVPSFGDSSVNELKEASRQSNKAISEMNHRVQWVHSYVAKDKIYCIYNAPNKEVVLEHAKKSGFPADSIEEVKTIIDPITAE